MRHIYVLYIFIYFVRLYDVKIVFTLVRSSRIHVSELSSN